MTKIVWEIIGVPSNLNAVFRKTHMEKKHLLLRDLFIYFSVKRREEGGQEFVYAHLSVYHNTQ